MELRLRHRQILGSRLCPSLDLHHLYRPEGIKSFLSLLMWTCCPARYAFQSCKHA